MVQRNNTELPPGFRFHPTDEELIMFYLRNQATSTPCPVSIIPEVDIYKFDPWELPEKAVSGENEWYFFTPRDRKYPNGVRPNRTAVSGYWKATGTDKIIYSGTEYVGVKKALVFYKGKPPKGVKTDWIMHEYRLNDPKRLISHKQNGSMRLDDWVLCRIYKKKNNKLGRGSEQNAEDSGAQTGTSNDASNLQMLRTCSLSNLWELDRLGSLSQLLNDNSYNNNPNFDHQNNNPNSDHQNTTGDAGNGSSGGIEKNHLGGLPYQYMDSVKFQANHSSAMMNQPIFGNPMFQFQ